jgi:hypothetical protein
MVGFTTLPLVGQDASGNNVMLLTKENNTSILSANSEAIGTQQSNWPTTQVAALYQSGSDLLGVGYGIDARGGNQDLAWKYSGGNWTITPAGSLPPIRNEGVAYDGGKWIIATGQGVIASDFNYASPTATGGLSSTSATYTTLTKAPADSLNKGPVLVAASIGTTGTWTSDDWTKHNVGQATQLATGHMITTYTFPGASGSQVQYANAVPNGDTVPSSWHTVDAGEEGYYGLTGCPEYTITWTT